ncbi:class A beta-lactamase-related serine hydrolase [Holdemanella sp. MSK.7.32]|uniref:class A beta-lactamase-related serine hydrolase n=1 Tax=Holdemanella sp. MSK.7.32 TaxID=2965273 RepID=UPI00210C2028|nr:class A beta-lactamase-related serine hydrolase [Holdemanella sp. MSK.7.32]MCQ4804244.1 class A beta-lactamase-related serine hydrolase [Holdemanella sp. MSK.7.32]
MDKKNKIIIISLLSALLIVLCVFAVEMKNTEKKAYQGISEIGEDQNTEVENKDNSQYIDMSLAKDIEAYFQENGIDHEKVAYCITDLEHNIKYSMNEKDEFIAASIYKLPLAMLYYDKVNEGEYTLDSTFTYSGYMHEDAGVISSDYGIGSQVPLSDLLNNLIIYSDNDAGHILYENLGGWKEYKEAMTKYTDSISENYYTMDNVTTANTMNDVVTYLYDHKEDYKGLIKNMEEAEPGEYLDRDTQLSMPQKYGMYDSALNSVGFVECNTSYSIVVLTSLGDKGADVMANINRIAYEHFK